MESRLCRVPQGVHSSPAVLLKQADASQPDSAIPMATAVTRWLLRPWPAKPALRAHEAQRLAAPEACAGVVWLCSPAVTVPGRAGGGIAPAAVRDVFGPAAASPDGRVMAISAMLAAAVSMTRPLRITGTTPLGAPPGSPGCAAVLLIACAPGPAPACPAAGGPPSGRCPAAARRR